MRDAIGVRVDGSTLHARYGARYEINDLSAVGAIGDSDCQIGEEELAFVIEHSRHCVEALQRRNGIPARVVANIEVGLIEHLEAAQLSGGKTLHTSAVRSDGGRVLELSRHGDVANSR